MPNRFDKSVTASATCLSFAAALTTSSMRTRPSTIEYSECTRKWTKAGPACTACCEPAGAPASCITISILCTVSCKIQWGLFYRVARADRVSGLARRAYNIGCSV